MLSKCANPDCSATFLYLHEGKLFRLEAEAAARTADNGGPETRKPARRLEFFWLCSECAAKMTLVFKKDTGIEVRPTVRSKSAAS